MVSESPFLPSFGQDTISYTVENVLDSSQDEGTMVMARVNCDKSEVGPNDDDSSGNSSSSGIQLLDPVRAETPYVEKVMLKDGGG